MYLKRRKCRNFFFLALLLALVFAVPVQALPGETTLISRFEGPFALDANDGSFYKAPLSSDGRYIVFQSEATNLVSQDTNGVEDVFLYDRESGVTERVSLSSSTVQSNGNSINPFISADGRFVAFQSTATNLVPGDTNGWEDIFVYDRQTSRTERISVSTAGVEADNDSSSPVLSADGRFVAFTSTANNLVDGDLNGWSDVFVYDRQTGEMERVSHTGAVSAGSSFDPSISADGRYVAFGSDVDHLVSGDTNQAADIFVYDRLTDQTERVSVASDGSQAVASSYSPVISADGRYVAFTSYASNLVDNDTNDVEDIFLYDRETDAIEGISVSSNGMEGNGNSAISAISPDGRFVAFGSSASNLVDSDTNNRFDIFVRDRQEGETERVSIDSNGKQGNEFSSWPAISADGRFVTFASSAANLVDRDRNERTDIFIHDRQAHVTEKISHGPFSVTARGGSTFPSISADGRYVAFQSEAGDLIHSGPDVITSILVYDRQADHTENVSVASNGTEANSNSFSSMISANGQFVVFRSMATNLVEDDTNRMDDIFVHDRQSGITERVSVSTSGEQADSFSLDPSISADGRYVAYASLATNLAPNNALNYSDIFVHDRQTNTTILISVSSTGMPGNGDSGDPMISADGRFVVFTSRAYNLVSSDTNNSADIFVHDLQSHKTSRVSMAFDGTQANNGSSFPSISGDGRYVAFSSLADNLTPTDANETQDVFVVDRQTGYMEKISDGIQGQTSSEAAISSNGRYVAFASSATNLINGDTNETWDIFVYDRLTHRVQPGSVTSDKVLGNQPSYSPAISADGQYVVFNSEATNLVSDDLNQAPDIFLHQNDFQPTVLRIALAGPNPSALSSVTFTVAFSSHVTGLDQSDFSLQITGLLTGAKVIDVFPNPGCSGYCDYFTVTVQTGSKNGVLRLDLKDDDSIKDAGGLPLGGTGGGNGDYTSGQSYTILKTSSFTDVSTSHPYYQDIEVLYANNLTGGCATGPLKFCPDQIMNRAQAAAFMLRGNFGPSYLPPVPTHVFKDDWCKGLWAEGWAEGMRNEGFSAGCQASPLKYCPWDQIPREQAVIFALKLKYGKDYMAPPASGTVFADMTNPSYYATSWAETAYKEGIIQDCGLSGGKPKFCPKTLVSRGLAAYMIVRAKSLTMP